MREGLQGLALVAILLAVVALAVWMVPVSAQTNGVTFATPPPCVWNRLPLLQWGQPGAMSVTLPPVPPGRVWVVRAAGGFTNDNSGPKDYMMELRIPANTGACCWYVPLQRNQNPLVDHTPVIALERTLVMRAGEILALRMCCTIVGSIGINAAVDDGPEGCPILGLPTF